MLLRALLLLALVTAASLALTYALGEKVLIALGLILLQIQIIGKKLVSLELPAILAWLKAQAVLFFRIELLKKWVMTTLLPLLMGSALRRRLEGVILAAKAENIGDDASVRAKGLLSQVDDAALKGMEVVEKAAPALAALGMVFGASRLARPRRKKSKKR